MSSDISKENKWSTQLYNPNHKNFFKENVDPKSTRSYEGMKRKDPEYSYKNKVLTDMTNVMHKRSKHRKDLSNKN